jgi:large subunit ribosomal protein L23
MDARVVIKRFLATEKSTVTKESQGKYAFVVDSGANKHQIKTAIEQLFKVDVASVRTITVPGKLKRLGRYEGKTPTWKKAIIKLKGDAQITEFENL